MQGQELAHDLGDEALNGNVLEVKPAGTAWCGEEAVVVLQRLRDGLDESAQLLAADRDGLQAPGSNVVALHMVQGTPTDE
jgi:hypothetical protein